MIWRPRKSAYASEVQRSTSTNLFKTSLKRPVNIIKNLRKKYCETKKGAQRRI